MTQARILIVEDEALIAADIKDRLECLDYTVVAAVASGEEAVELIRKDPPDIVLMDIFLCGEMTGLQAAERIRSLCATPVVFLTSNADTEIVERATKAEAFGYIIKPFSDQDLYATLEMALHRHRIEQELRSAQAELRKLSRAVEQSSATVVITDREGNIEYTNPKFTEVTGYSRKQALGKNSRILKSGKQGPEVYKDLWQTITSGREWRGEMRNRKKNGELYWEEASISPVRNEEGEITHFVAVKEDITARKQAEKELKKAKADADAANQAKGAFLANMSHEIRTPMNGIIGMIGLALETEPTKEQAEYLQMARSSAEGLLALIGDILDFSKIEAHRLKIETNSFNLHQCLETTIKPFSVASHQKGIEVLWEVQPEVPEFLIGDSGRLRQVLINLLGNAIKFTERGSILTQVGLESEEDVSLTLHFVVKDTGIGIPGERVEEIFEPFKQIDGSLKRDYNGTGLGLAICQQLVLLMGGRLWTESEPGHGSAFHFTLQLERAPVIEFAVDSPAEGADILSSRDDSNNAVVTASTIQERAPHILLAEDQIVNQALAETLLSKRGYRVSTANNGKQALDLLNEKQFDIVLMDISMPLMDGLEATSLIREGEKGSGRHIPIIAMTAHAMKGDRERFMEAGMDAYVSKPIRPNELFEAIETILSHEGGLP